MTPEEQAVLDAAETFIANVEFRLSRNVAQRSDVGTELYRAFKFSKIHEAVKRLQHRRTDAAQP